MVSTAAEIRRPTTMAAMPVRAMSTTSSSTGGLRTLETLGPSCCDTAMRVRTVDCTTTKGTRTTSLEVR